MARPQFSQMLVERRRQLGYSTGQAARALRLKEDVLVAFEEGDFASMPKSGYAQGMLASYARFLGLDAHEVTNLFVRALDEYRAVGSVRGPSRGSGSVRRMTQRREGPVTNQPQVPSRGYLPTSGGIAGDLGDYATTSAVRPHRHDGAYQPRSRSYGTSATTESASEDARYSSSALGRSRRVPHRSGNLEEGRYDRGARDAVRRARYDYGRDEVTTMSVDDQYVDDLRYDDEPRPFAPASTSGGRAPMRDLPVPDRPNVQRRPSNRQRQQVRGRGRRQEPQGFFARLTSDPLRFIGLVIVLVAAIITLILVISISSCGAFRTSSSDTDKTVPVQQTTTQSSTATSDDKSEEEAAAEKQIAESSGSSEDGTTSTGQATVVVSVADDAVTWIEIESDGESKVAETVTGPWTQSYTVTSSITIQAADTTAVTVTNNGKQVQFDSRASGIGTVTIKVAQASSSSEESSSATTDDSTGSDADADTDGGVSSSQTTSDSSGSTSGNTNDSSTSGDGTAGSKSDSSSSSTSGRTTGSNGTVSGSLGGSTSTSGTAGE